MLEVEVGGTGYGGAGILNNQPQIEVNLDQVEEDMGASVSKLSCNSMEQLNTGGGGGGCRSKVVSLVEIRLAVKWWFRYSNNKVQISIINMYLHKFKINI